MTVLVEFPWCKELAGCSGGKEWYRWRPGVRFEAGDGDAVADGSGDMLLTEIGRYTPPGYRERVFYTRQFVLPSGEAVGVPRLKVIGAAGFTRLTRGYRYPYEVVSTLVDVLMEQPEMPLEDVDPTFVSALEQALDEA